MSHFSLSKEGIFSVRLTLSCALRMSRKWVLFVLIYNSSCVCCACTRTLIHGIQRWLPGVFLDPSSPHSLTQDPLHRLLCVQLDRLQAAGSLGKGLGSCGGCDGDSHRRTGVHRGHEVSVRLGPSEGWREICPCASSAQGVWPLIGGVASLRGCGPTQGVWPLTGFMAPHRGCDLS